MDINQEAQNSSVGIEKKANNFASKRGRCLEPVVKHGARVFDMSSQMKQ